MGKELLGQLIRNAVDAENAAAAAYRSLAGRVDDEKVSSLFSTLAEQEDHHARDIENYGRRLTEQGLPDGSDIRVDAIEKVVDWPHMGSMDLSTAIEMAIDAELSAELFYDAMADALEGAGKSFFTAIARTEANHAVRLRKLKDLVT